jgi:redox-sensitive bicupin YhaK (pirin superfamily)
MGNNGVIGGGDIQWMVAGSSPFSSESEGNRITSVLASGYRT